MIRARRARDAGAVCNCVGIESKSQRMRLASVPVVPADARRRTGKIPLYGSARIFDGLVEMVPRFALEFISVAGDPRAWRHLRGLARPKRSDCVRLPAKGARGNGRMAAKQRLFR